MPMFLNAGRKASPPTGSTQGCWQAPVVGHDPHQIEPNSRLTLSLYQTLT
jgi:hypothetical protein